MIRLFLRLAIGSGFLSAVADRFGFWNPEVAAWGNWDNFLAYTQAINPWFPESLIPIIGGIATAAEVVFGVALILGFKTEFFAKLSGCLLLLFALSMWFSTGIKGPLDYSVFTASAGAFAIGLSKKKILELDNLFNRTG